MPVETSYCCSCVVAGTRHRFLAKKALSPFSLLCVVVVYANRIGTPRGDLGMGELLVDTPAQRADSFNEGKRKVFNRGISIVNSRAYFHERANARGDRNILGPLFFPNS